MYYEDLEGIFKKINLDGRGQIDFISKDQTEFINVLSLMAHKQEKEKARITQAKFFKYLNFLSNTKASATSNELDSIIRSLQRSLETNRILRSIADSSWHREDVAIIDSYTSVVNKNLTHLKEQASQKKAGRTLNLKNIRGMTIYNKLFSELISSSPKIRIKDYHGSSFKKKIRENSYPISSTRLICNLMYLLGNMETEESIIDKLKKHERESIHSSTKEYQRKN